MEFTARLLESGKTATGIEVPPDVVTELGGGRRPKVRATVGGYTYRTSIASMHGRFMLPVSAEVRERSGVRGGDEVEVTVVLDTEERVVELPADLSAVLTAHPSALARFHTLSYSEQRRLVLAVESAKAAETRQRRIDKTIDSLREQAV